MNILGLASLLITSTAYSEGYNHGNHNAPYNQFLNGTESANCGRHISVSVFIETSFTTDIEREMYQKS
ncbi:hypothetical protein DZA50_05925 [Kangiella sp. HD9-110m-PIT-SAG07]|nr:hypothetical protein DZA50_05925 [Kangiella sp. HD9-110m-PIT-SAG07]